MSRPTPTYDECYAYAVLEKAFGLTNFKLADKPDLIDEENSIGVEVVNAIPKDIFFIQYNYNNIIKNEGLTTHNSNIKELDNKPNHFTDENWFEYNNYLFKDREIEEEEMFKLLEATIERKAKKKDGYRKLNEYGLYLYLRTPITYNKNIFIQKLKTIYDLYKQHFQIIYFYVLNESVIIRINNDDIIKHKVNKIELSKKAMQLQSNIH